ncbi:MAG: hypothetical protein JEY99_02860 [Spirochaetales bacterium]|nr:hypothetical protein [Spirochaetales bacterium]
MDKHIRDIKEYDRFGPWVFEISDDDPVPPIFQSFADTKAPSILSFKVPRPIERRKASPGMDLYDYLIILREENFEILQRQGNEVKKRTTAYKDILSIQCSQDLLRGTFLLITEEKTYSFPFNTVSEELIDRMISILLERFPKLSSPLEVEDEAKAEEWKLGPHFSRLLNKEKREEPEQRCFGAQGQVLVASKKDSVFKRMWYGVIDKRTFESLHFCDGQMLKILGRAPLYRYRGRADYRIDKIYIPLPSLTGIDWKPDPKQKDVMILTYKVGQETFTFAVTRNNIEPYQKYLKSLKL